MFEHIVLRKAEGGQNVSAGQIAEALLYYQKLHLIIDRGTLLDLVRQIGLDLVLSLLKRHDVSAVYCEEFLGTQTITYAATQFHTYSEIMLMGTDETPLNTPEDRLQFDLERQGILKKDARRFSRDFLKIIPIRKYSGNYFRRGGIAAAAKQDLLDTEYANRAISRAIELLPGGYKIGRDLKFELLESEKGFCVFSNIDLKSINETRSKFNPPLEPLSIAHLLTNILDSRADLELASFYGGDFVTSALNSSIIQVRHAELLRRTELNKDSRQQFTELVLPDTPSLAEVIDSGERTFKDFLSLLDKSARFKNWLKTVNPDESLIRTYLRDVSSEDWIQRLPSKSIRYIFTTAVDAYNPIAGLATGIVDNFLIDKLGKGWRPNHFVSSRLSPFVRKNS